LLRLLVAPGQVVEADQPLFEVTDLNQVWLKVLLNTTDQSRVAAGQSAHILSLDNDDEEAGENGFEAEAIEAPNGDDQGDADEDGDEEAVLYYAVDNPQHNLALGDRVRVELPLYNSGAKRIVIPYAAVLYDAHGDSWVYTNPEPLVFIRRPIVIDTIEGDLAYLTVGPYSGMEVVTVGAAELFGAETGVSK
jgi:multidrug efflux pump subunit AcrA (membrane-fusion protein)